MGIFEVIIGIDRRLISSSEILEVGKEINNGYFASSHLPLKSFLTECMSHYSRMIVIPF